MLWSVHPQQVSPIYCTLSWNSLYFHSVFQLISENNQNEDDDYYLIKYRTLQILQTLPSSVHHPCENTVPFVTNDQLNNHTGRER